LTAVNVVFVGFYLGGAKQIWGTATPIRPVATCLGFAGYWRIKFCNQTFTKRSRRPYKALSTLATTVTVFAATVVLVYFLSLKMAATVVSENGQLGNE